jgi:arylsulfatase A
VHNTNANGYAIRHGDWVLIETKTGGISAVPGWYDVMLGYSKNTQPGELYNLKEDLAQKNNLYSSNPEKVAELSNILKEIKAQGQVR